MRARLLPALVLPALLLHAAPAAACSVCGCGDPILSTSDPAALAGRLRLQLDEEYLRMDAANDADPDATDELTQWSTRLNVAWRPVDDLSLSLSVPWVKKEIVTVGPLGSETASDLSGLGDLELTARWTAWRSADVGARRYLEAALTGGTTAPTGKKDARDAAGALIDPHGQVGTGGWGPTVGATFRAEQGDWTAFVAASWRWRTEASYFDGSRYKLGDALLGSLHAQYQAGRRWVLDLGLDARHAAADRATDDAGAVEPRVPNTGGAVVALAPGVWFNPGGGLWLFARAQVPVYQDLYGVQDVKTTAAAGLQYLAF